MRKGDVGIASGEISSSPQISVKTVRFAGSIYASTPTQCTAPSLQTLLLFVALLLALGDEVPDKLEELLVEIEQVHAKHRESQRDEPRHGHVGQEMRAHAEPGKRHNRRPEAANQTHPLFLALKKFRNRRHQRDQHRAGGAGCVAGREGAELVGRNTLSNQLVLERAARLPPRRKIACVPC